MQAQKPSKSRNHEECPQHTSFTHAGVSSNSRHEPSEDGREPEMGVVPGHYQVHSEPEGHSL